MVRFLRCAGIIFCAFITNTGRCGSKEFGCTNVCGKKLSCGQHSCPSLCHPGLVVTFIVHDLIDSCPLCKLQSLQPCCCGKEVQLVRCSTSGWHCKSVCGKLLSCGNHNCELVCHSGNCLPCKLSGPRECPCGKTS